ncbi:MAG: hypothetical protein ACP5E5_15400 [Acidobacteriaceae bacterium]
MSRSAVLVLLACVVLPPCVAAKLHQHRITGVYLTHDGQVIQTLARRTPGIYWIDGYSMTVTKQTQTCWHDAPLKFGPVLNKDGRPIPRLTVKSPCESTPPVNLKKSVWLQYQGIQKYRIHPLSHMFYLRMDIPATRIDIWNGDNGDEQSQTAPTQTWRTLCASASPHELRYPNEGPINVVCDTRVNSYVENVFSSLLKPSAITPDAPIAKQETPSFYVVEPFQVEHNYDFEAMDGSTGYFDLASNQSWYKNPHAHSTVREIVFASDGTMLIPDIALAHLKNEAELAALLSYSLAAENQEIIAHFFQVQRFKGKPWSTNKGGANNLIYTGNYLLHINEQVLRLGIRQMYLAGYDIRYAPFAWSVEQGKRIKGSVDEPNKHMPWYAAYAFNAINQLYPNVDYSKLKRGEKEYQQFLQELRKADPGAFAGKQQTAKP